MSVIGFGTQAMLSGVVLGDNANEGLRTTSPAVARVGGSTATGNAVGLGNASGTLESFGDNLVRGNAAETSGTITMVAKT